MSQPWMPLYIGDYLADTAHLQTVEHGAYLLLIMHYWRTGGLPDDDGRLARIARMTAAEWRRARPSIEPLFEGGWKHKRIELELEKSAKISESARRGGIASGEARKRKIAEKSTAETNDRSTTVQRNANDQPTNREALQSHLPSQREEPSLRSGETRASALLVSDWPPDYRERFWQAFPNKVGKADAVAKLERVHKRGDVPFAELMAGLDRYSRKTDDRPWCNPATWINQQRWTDQPATGPPAARRPETEWERKQREMREVRNALTDSIGRRSPGGSADADGVLPGDGRERSADFHDRPRAAVLELFAPHGGQGAECDSRAPGLVQADAFHRRNS